MTARDRIALLAVASAAALAGFWFLALAPKRHEAATLASKLSQQHKRLQTARADVSASEAARSSYAANYTAVAQLGKAVPADDDVPSLVYQLDSTASQTGVNFQAIKLASGTASAPPPAPAPAPAASSSSSSGSSGSSSSSSSSGSSATAATSTSGSTPAAPTQALTATLPPGAVVGPAGLATLPFSFTFDGSFFRLSDFFGRLERYIRATNRGVSASGRLLTVDAISLDFAQTGYPHLKANVAATAYLLPASEGLLDGASPSGPSQGGAQPVGTSGAPPATAPATATSP